MADKKEPAAGWPVISGDYIVGDPESPVAVTTLASHIEAELSGAAIAGPCKTENLGVEKVVANIISCLLYTSDAADERSPLKVTTEKKMTAKK